MTSTTPTIKEIDRFLRDYQKQNNSFERLRIADFETGFQRLSAGLQSLQKLAWEIERVSAPRFNIFTLLGVARIEVATHSAILADLWNTKGNMVKEICFKCVFPDPGSLCSTIFRSPELGCGKGKVTYRGNLDIVLSNHSRKSRSGPHPLDRKSWMISEIFCGSRRWQNDHDGWSTALTTMQSFRTWVSRDVKILKLDRNSPLTSARAVTSIFGGD